MSDDAEPTPQTADAQGGAGAAQPCGSEAEQLKALRDGWSTGGGPLAELRRCALAAHANRWKTIARLTLQSVTPIYGGGSTPGQVDWMLPLRPRAIKNAIRHWWWQLNRHQYAGRAGDLYKEMVAIWGGPSEEDADRSARVRLIVDEPTPQEVESHRFTYLPYTMSQAGTVRQDPNDPWLYALFGAKGKPRTGANWADFEAARQPVPGLGNGKFRLAQNQNIFAERPADLLAPGLTFELKICTRNLSCAQCEQIKNAFAFWLAFGGVGARTSRGLGRLRPTDVQRLQAVWQRVADVVRASAGTLSLEQPKTALNCQSPEQALLKLLDTYKAVRQSRDRPMGYTHWPKAEIVRRITGAVPVHLRHHRRSDFLPELMFGAPIVVDFQNRGPATTLSFARQNANTQVELQRYPSPLLFGAKPHGNCWEPVVLVIDPTRDFRGRMIHALLKWKYHGAGKSHLLPPGAWWPDFNKPTYARDLTRLTRALRVPGAARACTPFDLFLGEVRNLTP